MGPHLRNRTPPIHPVRKKGTAGVLQGALISGVQMAISMINTGRYRDVYVCVGASLAPALALAPAPAPAPALALALYVCIYIYIYIYMYVCISIYIYIYTWV